MAEGSGHIAQQSEISNLKFQIGVAAQPSCQRRSSDPVGRGRHKSSVNSSKFRTMRPRTIAAFCFCGRGVPLRPCGFQRERGRPAQLTEARDLPCLSPPDAFSNSADDRTNKSSRSPFMLESRQPVGSASGVSGSLIESRARARTQREVRAWIVALHFR